MTEYRYVIVAADGRSWLLQGDEEYDPNADNNCVLPRLLREGWQPVRERSCPGQDGALALVLVKRRVDGDGRAVLNDDDIPF
jgi:hypothetical protein